MKKVYGAGAAFFCLEPESAPGPRTSGAALKSGDTAFNDSILVITYHCNQYPAVCQIRIAGYPAGKLDFWKGTMSVLMLIFLEKRNLLQLDIANML